jgi:hypothetical protein
MSPVDLPAIGLAAEPDAIDSPESDGTQANEKEKDERKQSPEFLHPPLESRERVTLNSRPARVVGSFDHPVLPMPPVCI